MGDTRMDSRRKSRSIVDIWSYKTYMKEIIAKKGKGDWKGLWNIICPCGISDFWVMGNKAPIIQCDSCKELLKITYK